MYSHEIDSLVRSKDNIVSVQDYFKILDSLQVDHVRHDNGIYQIWTTDGFYWSVRIGKGVV